MNRRKSQASLGYSSLILVAIAVAIVSSGGVAYVVMKNKQVTARSKIEKVQRKMDEHRVSISLHESNIGTILGYYPLRRQLADMKSPLVEIQYVEVCRRTDAQSAEDSIAYRE